MRGTGSNTLGGFSARTNSMLQSIAQSWNQAGHRGPFRFLVTRPSKGRHPFVSEWLQGSTEAEDVESEALALLSDRRDRIVRVAVWSVRDSQFVMTFPIRKEQAQ